MCFSVCFLIVLFCCSICCFVCCLRCCCMLILMYVLLSFFVFRMFDVCLCVLFLVLFTNVAHWYVMFALCCCLFLSWLRDSYISYFVFTHDSFCFCYLCCFLLFVFVISTVSFFWLHSSFPSYLCPRSCFFFILPLRLPFFRNLLCWCYFLLCVGCVLLLFSLFIS